MFHTSSSGFVEKMAKAPDRGIPRQAPSPDSTRKDAPDRLVESAFAVVVEYRGSWKGCQQRDFQVDLLLGGTAAA
jgi:hypothetical protein